MVIQSTAAKRAGLIFTCALATAAPPVQNALVAQEAVSATGNPDGSSSVPAVVIPYSDLASSEARQNTRDLAAAFAKLKQLPATTDIAATRRGVDELLMIPGLAVLRKAFPVKIEEAVIGGVTVDIVTPADGVKRRNRSRVLINLHGGGFILGARYSGQMEAVPIASISGYEVITVDYRMGPEATFPAASEDVASVYRELLKRYRPQDIGIYGCSAGGMLTAQSLAWFETHGLPTPGAAGMFHGAAVLDHMGDSAYFAPALSGGRIPLAGSEINPYLAGASLSDPLISPVRDPKILQKFPPSLLISGTRDPMLSSVLYSHAQLVAAGVDAYLHVWEGAGHCHFAQPVADPRVPETRQAWNVIVDFFDRHLGRRPKPRKRAAP